MGVLVRREEGADHRRCRWRGPSPGWRQKTYMCVGMLLGEGMSGTEAAQRSNITSLLLLPTPPRFCFTTEAQRERWCCWGESFWPQAQCYVGCESLILLFVPWKQTWDLDCRCVLREHRRFCGHSTGRKASFSTKFTSCWASRRHLQPPLFLPRASLGLSPLFRPCCRSNKPFLGLECGWKIY